VSELSQVELVRGITGQAVLVGEIRDCDDRFLDLRLDPDVEIRPRRKPFKPAGRVDLGEAGENSISNWCI
jgi:hypothetical protein